MAKNLFDAIASAAANITAQIKDYIETVALVEKDPTVHAWAKEPVKPTYNVSEIFAIAPVAESNYYGDLYGLPELPASEIKAEEFLTGQKWINGEPIYARAFNLTISSGASTTLMQSDGLKFLKFEGVLLGSTGTTMRVLTGDSSGSTYFRVGMDSATRNIYVHSDTTGTAKVVAYYIKA